MGGAVIRAALQSANIKLVGAIDKPGSPRISKDAGEISRRRPSSAFQSANRSHLRSNPTQ